MAADSLRSSSLSPLYSSSQHHPHSQYSSYSPYPSYPPHPCTTYIINPTTNTNPPYPVLTARVPRITIPQYNDEHITRRTTSGRTFALYVLFFALGTNACILAMLAGAAFEYSKLDVCTAAVIGALGGAILYGTIAAPIECLLINQVLVRWPDTSIHRFVFIISMLGSALLPLFSSWIGVVSLNIIKEGNVDPYDAEAAGFYGGLIVASGTAVLLILSEVFIGTKI